jgi:hypothetical protein
MLEIAIVSKIFISLALLSSTIILGVILHKLGKPYNQILFNLHKLISLGLVIYLFLTIYNIFTNNELNMVIYIFVSIALLSVVALFVSGAFFSQDKLNDLMLRIHSISTGIFVFCLAFLLYRFMPS